MFVLEPRRTGPFHSLPLVFPDVFTLFQTVRQFLTLMLLVQVLPWPLLVRDQKGEKILYFVAAIYSGL